MNRAEQWIMWFNSLTIEEKAKILGIDVNDFDELDIVALNPEDIQIYEYPLDFDNDKPLI